MYEKNAKGKFWSSFTFLLSTLSALGLCKREKVKGWDWAFEPLHHTKLEFSTKGSSKKDYKQSWLNFNTNKPSLRFLKLRFYCCCYIHSTPPSMLWRHLRTTTKRQKGEIVVVPRKGQKQGQKKDYKRREYLLKPLSKHVWSRKIQSRNVQVSLFLRGRYVPRFWTVNTEFAYKKAKYD